MTLRHPVIFSTEEKNIHHTRSGTRYPSFPFAGHPVLEPDPYQSVPEHVILNKDLDLVYAHDFYPVGGDLPDTPWDPPVKGYTSKDPRLADVLRNDTLILDRPPYQPANVQPLCRPDGSEILPSASVMPSYEEIHGGNLQYYTDASLSEAFYPPMYQIPSRVRSSIFRDPMGSLKAYYEKTPILRRNAPLSEYSFDQDQMSFREDIMSRQQSLMDRTDYQKFHSHFSSPSDSSDS